MTVDQFIVKMLGSKTAPDIVSVYYDTFKKDIQKSGKEKIFQEFISGKLQKKSFPELAAELKKYNAKKSLRVMNELIKRKQEYIDTSILKNREELSKGQQKLYNTITKEFIPGLETDSGNLVSGKKNFYQLSKLDAITDKFNKSFNEPYVKGFADDLVATASYTESYYLAAGLGQGAVKSALKATDTLYARIGIDAEGNILKSGYIGQLSRMPEVQNQLRDYVLNNVSNGTSSSEFVSGFDELINGSDDIDGALERYHNEFAFDVYNQADETENEFMAEQNGLTYFVYSGTVMKNTRCFCAKRNNKVFSTEDAKQWVNDPTLPGKDKTGYNPLIDRGRYNCRHAIQYIDEEMAMQLGYDPDEAAAINKEQCSDRR